jgi:hypothetical protein
MAKQNSTEILKERIKLLEIRQTEEGNILKAQFEFTCENLKPVNLLKNAVKEFASSAELRETILESSAILISGVISKKIMDSTKGGPLIRLLTSLLQLGATGLIRQYNSRVQDFVMGLVDRLLRNHKEE